MGRIADRLHGYLFVANDGVEAESTRAASMLSQPFLHVASHICANKHRQLEKIPIRRSPALQYTPTLPDHSPKPPVQHMQ